MKIYITVRSYKPKLKLQNHRSKHKVGSGTYGQAGKSVHRWHICLASPLPLVASICMVWFLLVSMFSSSFIALHKDIILLWLVWFIFPFFSLNLFCFSWPQRESKVYTCYCVISDLGDGVRNIGYNVKYNFVISVTLVNVICDTTNDTTHYFKLCICKLG